MPEVVQTQTGKYLIKNIFYRRGVDDQDKTLSPSFGDRPLVSTIAQPGPGVHIYDASIGHSI